MMNAQFLCKLRKDFCNLTNVGRDILIHNVRRGSELQSYNFMESESSNITGIIVQREYAQRNKKLSTIISCTHIKKIDF